MLAVTLSKNARARAVQLPAWNEALGLPRPFDQQWSLRMQQILAYETDLLEYGDIFDGSTEIADKVEELKREAREELSRHREARRRDRGGRDGLHEGAAGREQLQRGWRRSSAASRSSSASTSSSRPSPRRSRPAKARSSPCRTRSRPSRSSGSTPGARRATPRPSKAALQELRDAAASTAATSCRPRSRPRKPASPPANGARRLREAFGEYRAPTGVGRAARNESPGGRDEVRADVDRVSQKLGRRSSSWSASPASTAIPTAPSRSRCARAMPAWTWSIEGIRLTPAEIVNAARRKACTWSGCRSCPARMCRW